MRSVTFAVVTVSFLSLVAATTFASNDLLLRIDAQTVRSLGPRSAPVTVEGTDERAPQLRFTHATRAYDGQPLAGGGYLLCDGWLNPAAVNSAGQIVFYAQVLGNERNQGIFMADANGIRPIVMGCGGMGGSGDPGPCGDVTPTGGNYAGMFGGSFIAPALNERGDVLFISDVYKGPNPRCVFLYRAAQRDVIKLIGVNDPSPLGHNITAVGPGSLNNAGQAVFFANTENMYPDIYYYDGTSVSLVVAIGDPAPFGTRFAYFSDEAFGFPDGTWISTGQVPDINDAGEIAFYGWLRDDTYGLFVWRQGVISPYVHTGDPTPLGGTFYDFYAPHLNNRGEMAIFAEFQPPGGGWDSAWFVGQPGNWRKALCGSDRVDGLPITVVAVSRNPVEPFDDCGNLLAFCQVGEAWLYRTVMIDATGAIHVVARQGDPTPLGGTFGRLQGWPGLANNGLISFGAEAWGGTADTGQFVSRIGNRPGDLNNNGQLDGEDWLALVAMYTGPGVCTGTIPARVFDFDGDVDVDLRDAADFQAGFGTN